MQNFRCKSYYDGRSATRNSLSKNKYQASINRVLDKFKAFNHSTLQGFFHSTFSPHQKTKRYIYRVIQV